MIHQALLPPALEPEPEAETEPEADASVGTATQSVLAVEPFLSVFVLPGQALQTAEPMSALKVSAGHLTAASPSTPLYPAGALQAAMTSEPVMPAPVLALVGQALQSAEPMAALNVSWGHAVAEPPSGPV